MAYGTDYCIPFLNRARETWEKAFIHEIFNPVIVSVLCRRCAIEDALLPIFERRSQLLVQILSLQLQHYLLGEYNM